MPDAAAVDQTPTFSVVIAAYQSAAFVADAISSALAQDPPPLEVIVGDDESTDDLAGAVAPFGSAVTVVRIAHGGEAAAKNAAAARATGDFLAFLDADDRFLPGRLAAIRSLSRAHPELDVITTDANLVHDGNVLGRAYGSGHPFPDGDQRTEILRRNFVLGSAAVRRTRFEAVGGFDTSIAFTTDWDLWLRLILSGSIVGFVPEALADYRLHEASASARRADMARGRLDTLARAAARADLSATERALVEQTRAHTRAVLAQEELRDALATGANGGARRAAWQLLIASGQRPRTRAKALAALVAPAVARRRVQSVAAEFFVTVGDRRLPRAR